MTTLRIAVCQLECHPAIFTSDISYLNEPFLPAAGQPSVSSLTTRGLDFGNLGNSCREQYLSWHEARVRAVLEFIKLLHPQPDLLLFPEGSIPLELLRLLADWSAVTGGTVMAGSHTPRQSQKSLARYLALGVDEPTVRRLYRYGSINTLPLLTRGRLDLIPKRLLSPFERSVISAPARELPHVRPHELPLEGIRLLPLICSEALQLHSPTAQYDVVGIIAHDSKPEHFRHYIDLQVTNAKPVAFCNDGAAGQSFVYAVADGRVHNWLLHAFPKGLPPGDALLVVDADLTVTAVEVGTAVPRQALTLVSLASVVMQRGPTGAVSEQLHRIRPLPPDARALELKTLASSPMEDLQRARIEYLRRLDAEGVASDGWWSALGRDCVVKDKPSLRQLEATLAATCSRELISRIAAPVLRHGDTSALVVAYLAECDRRAKLAPEVRAAPIDVSADTHPPTLDRDLESREVHRFLDDASLVILELAGLQQIGKSSVLTKALAESGIQSVLRLVVTETSSADYIVQAIQGATPGGLTAPADTPVAQVQSAAFLDRLRALQVIVIEDAHLLLHRGQWRDDLVPLVLERLVRSVGQAKCKLILETRRQLPSILTNPAVRKIIRIYGLDRGRASYGVSLFDAQLRRAGLSPGLLGQADKTFIVSKLGGHPVAIALAADTAFEGGATALLQSLRAHRGFFLNFLARLVRALELSDQDRVFLQTLCLARIGVPREALLRSLDFPAAESLRDLVAIGAVEVNPDDLIEISSVLREYFDPGILTEPQRHAFHKAAAEAYAALVQAQPEALAAAVEAEYHAGVVGISVPRTAASRLVDGALASAFRLFASGEYDRAAQTVGPLLASRRTVDILRLAARIEAHRNNFDVALLHAREAFTRDPGDTELLADLAKIALNQYRDDIAEDMIGMARAAGVEAVAVLIVEGRMRVRRHEFEQAERVFRRATELSRNNAWPYYFLGTTYMQIGHLDEALEAFVDGENLFYTSQARNRRVLLAIQTKTAVVHLLNGRSDLAGPIVNSLMKEDPDNPEILRAQGAMIIAREGVTQTSKALELLTKAQVKTRRDRAQLHLFAGIFYLGIRDRASAADEFRRGLSVDSGNVLLMMKLARTLFDLAVAAWKGGDETFRAYLGECKSVVRRILRFDRDNGEGVVLAIDISNVFGSGMQ